jgi:hypothetical protein
MEFWDFPIELENNIALRIKIPEIIAKELRIFSACVNIL